MTSPRLRTALFTGLAGGLVCAAAACSEPPAPQPVAVPKELPVNTANPTKGAAVADFQADAVYTDEKGGVAGVRGVHRVQGMPVIVLRIQSVPRVFLAFNPPPVSDRGEPHT